MIQNISGTKKHLFRAVCVLVLVVCGLGANAAEIAFPALVAAAEPPTVSTNAGKPTVIEDTIQLRVQDGANYIQLAADHLPAMIAYIPDTAFGPIPSAMQGADTELQAIAAFTQCQMIWGWQLEASDEAQLVTITAHENASLLVMPTVPKKEECETVTGEMTLSACSFEYGGQKFTESGEYELKMKTVAGCDSIVTLHLTIIPPAEVVQDITKCGSYTSPASGKTYTESGRYEDSEQVSEDGCITKMILNLTIIDDCSGEVRYFCPGMNTVHEDPDGTRYEEYQYESPAAWDFMEGVIIAGERSRTQVDLRRAENNLRSHYVEPLTPVQSISWSFRPEGESSYRTLNAGNEPQWVEAGTVAVRILFLCGQSYSSDFTTDIATVEAAAKPVKVIENGQVIIIRGGEKYSILGNKLR